MCRSVRCWGKSRRPSSQGSIWIDDRNFYTAGFLFGIARPGRLFLVRQHAATLTYTLVGKREGSGTGGNRRVFENAPSHERRG